MSDSTDIIVHPGPQRTPARRRRADHHVGPPPAIVAAAGGGAEFAWGEFFKGQIANAHTRKNYAHAVRHSATAPFRQSHGDSLKSTEPPTGWKPVGSAVG
jgi:hypothetical protein